MRGRLNTFRRDRKGATAVEFAIVAPLIFLSVLGTFETGRALYVRNHLSEAIATGARQAIISGATNTTAIETAIRAKFHSNEQSKFVVNQTNQTIGGRVFKKIEIVYNHSYIIHFGGLFHGLTFTMDRYVPAT